MATASPAFTTRARADAIIEHHGFSGLDVETAGRTLFMPLKRIAARLKRHEPACSAIDKAAAAPSNGLHRRG
jgi:hypothetical protein